MTGSLTLDHVSPASNPQLTLFGGKPDFLSLTWILHHLLTTYNALRHGHNRVESRNQNSTAVIVS